MTSRWFATIALAAGTVAGGTADHHAAPCAKPCREHPQLVAACFTFRGRMNYWNGAPTVRIWRVGTRRILGVSEQRFRLEGVCDLPHELAEKLSWDTDLFGEFTVCPLTEDKPGEMQLVCVESGTKLAVRERKP